MNAEKTGCVGMRWIVLRFIPFVFVRHDARFSMVLEGGVHWITRCLIFIACRAQSLAIANELPFDDEKNSFCATPFCKYDTDGASQAFPFRLPRIQVSSYRLI